MRVLVAEDDQKIASHLTAALQRFHRPLQGNDLALLDRIKNVVLILAAAFAGIAVIVVIVIVVIVAIIVAAVAIIAVAVVTGTRSTTGAGTTGSRT